MKNISEQIQSWLKEYVTDSKQKGFVIGVSGGIDSAVVSTLCAKTGIPTIVVGMPINSNSENTRLSDLQIALLSKTYSNVEGFNIGINVGIVAGQTIFHAHVHLIPLHDMDDIRFQRKTILTKEEFEKLAKAIQSNL